VVIWQPYRFPRDLDPNDGRYDATVGNADDAYLRIGSGETLFACGGPDLDLSRGYVLIWGTSGLIFYAVAEVGTIYVSHFPALAPLGLGAALVMAGLYQFTPLKKVCLRHCRSPFAFVAQHWREGRVGALLMGARHGLYCLGCCWVLFTVLMAAGMMSVGWMLLLTLVVFAEKLFPHGARISHVVGVLFVVCGLLYAIDGVSLFQLK
jgi:predicted metal-binding membrane protein